MTTTRTAPTGVRAAFILLMGMVLLPALAQAQYDDHFHLVLVSATVSGPNGDPVAPRAHVGETVAVNFVVENLDTFHDSIAVNNVSLVIHHAKGDRIIPNLTPNAVMLSSLGDVAEISTSFVVAPEDGDLLQIDADLVGSDNWDGLMLGEPLSFRAAWTMQIRVFKPAVAIAQQCEVSPAYSVMTIQGSVTNTGNTRLDNVWVHSDNGTPEDAADDTILEMGGLDPHRSAVYGGIVVPKGSASHNTVTVVATDSLGAVVYHSCTSKVQLAPPAVLRIAKSSATTLRVSWPITATGFRLESRDALAAAADWTPVTIPPMTSDNEWVVSLDISAPTRFYRLAKE